MTYKWNYLTLKNDEKECKEKLTHELNIDPVLAELLIHRGIVSVEDAHDFFHPKLEDLHDPFLMPDMKKAVKRIEKAIGNKERILIYGDYDVDGTTAVALVYKFLRKITNNIDYYIPDRYDEGYGISYHGIDYAVETGVKLIITLDCGIKAIDKVAYAKEKGIDFIICDHHMPDEKLPEAVAVVDAKRPDSVYPYAELSGCGVGYKLAQAISIRNGLPLQELEYLLDLVAVSIASDIVPVSGENRILMYYGLKQLNSNPSFGLRGIIDICGLARKEITSNDIVFKIGPRINASGRMMNGKEAVDLLLASDIVSARQKSIHIDKYNEDRRELDKKITEEAFDFVDNNMDMKALKCIVIYNESWHKGIIGIVASRLTERYFRPAIVLTKSNDMISGSARSVIGFDVYKAIESCRDILENFGGHTYAAGLSMKEENLDAFKGRFEDISFDEINPKMMRAQLLIDAEITLDEINDKFLSDLMRFRPFGLDNENPVFLTRGVKDAGGSRLVGKGLKHIKMELQTAVQKPMQGIAFGFSDFFKLFKEGNSVDICYHIEENLHGNNSFIQLIVQDIKIP